MPIVPIATNNILFTTARLVIFDVLNTSNILYKLENIFGALGVIFIPIVYSCIIIINYSFIASIKIG